jgi:hypothetical protein
MEPNFDPFISNTEAASKLVDAHCAELKADANHNHREAVRLLILGEAAGVTLLAARLPGNSWTGAIALIAVALLTVALLFAIRARFLFANEQDELNAKFRDWQRDVTRNNLAAHQAGEESPPDWPPCPEYPTDPESFKAQQISQGLLIFGAFVGFVFFATDWAITAFCS